MSKNNSSALKSSFSQLCVSRIPIFASLSSIEKVGQRDGALAREMLLIYEKQIETIQKHIISHDNELLQMEKKEQDERHAHNRRMSFLFSCGGLVRCFIAIVLIGMWSFLVIKADFHESYPLFLIVILAFLSENLFYWMSKK